MVVALPLIVRVAGVEAEALADGLGGVGWAADAPEDVPDVPDDVPEPDAVLVAPGEVLVLDEVLDVPGEVLVAEVLCRLAGLVWTPTPAGEHPNSVVDKTNTAVTALDVFMGSSWSSASHMSPNDDISITTQA